MKIDIITKVNKTKYESLIKSVKDLDKKIVPTGDVSESISAALGGKVGKDEIAAAISKAIG